LVSANLGSLYGDKRIDRIFPEIPSDLPHKPQQIFFILSTADNVDDLILRLQPIINVHRKYFDEPFKQNFNLILRKLNLKLDDHLNIKKIES